MRVFVKNAILFLLYFSFIFILINGVFFSIVLVTDWDWKKRLEALNLEDPDFDLVVLGSSLPEYGVDAGLLSDHGIKSYNLSILGNTVNTCYIQLNEYLTTYDHTPKYALLVLNSEMEPTDGNYIHTMVEYTTEGHRYTIEDFPVLKFSKWFGGELLKKIFSSNHRNATVVQGQIRRHYSRPDQSSFKEIYLDLDKFESSFWMGEIARLCDQHNVIFYVIEIPAQREFQNLSDVGPYTLHFKNKYSAQLYNYNSREFCAIIDPENDWVGDSHLNPGGAAKFTLELLKIFDTE
jgi:hypothetical protein